MISIVEGKYQVMIASIIALLIIQTLDGNVIEAKFIGKSIKVHPLLVVIFLIFGNAIGGLWGMLLAEPTKGPKYGTRFASPVRSPIIGARLMPVSIIAVLPLWMKRMTRRSMWTVHRRR